MPYRIIAFGEEDNIGPRLEYETRTIAGPDNKTHELNLLVGSWDQLEHLVERCGLSPECILEAALEDNAERDLMFPISMEMQNTIAHVYRTWLQEYGHQGPFKTPPSEATTV